MVHPQFHVQFQAAIHGKETVRAERGGWTNLGALGEAVVVEEGSERRVAWGMLEYS